MIKTKTLTLTWNLEYDPEGRPIWIAISYPFVFRVNLLVASSRWVIVLNPFRKVEWRLLVINRETQLLYYEILPSFSACKWRAAQVAWQGSF